MLLWSAYPKFFGEVPIQNTVEGTFNATAACCKLESINTRLSLTANNVNNSRADSVESNISAPSSLGEEGLQTCIIWWVSLYLLAIWADRLKGISLVQE